MNLKGLHLILLYIRLLSAIRTFKKCAMSAEHNISRRYAYFTSSYFHYCIRTFRSLQLLQINFTY